MGMIRDEGVNKEPAPRLHEKHLDADSRRVETSFVALSRKWGTMTRALLLVAMAAVPVTQPTVGTETAHSCPATKMVREKVHQFPDADPFGANSAS